MGVPLNIDWQQILLHAFNLIILAGGLYVLVLLDSAERPEDIDRLRAQHAADAAKEAILQKRSIREYREAHLTLARAIARLHVKSLSEQ